MRYLDLIDDMYKTADGEEELEAYSGKFGGNCVTQNDQPIIQKVHTIRYPLTGSLSHGSSQRIKIHAGPYPYETSIGSALQPYGHHNSRTARV